jgi:hypothetical protein
MKQSKLTPYTSSALTTSYNQRRTGGGGSVGKQGSRKFDEKN